MPISEARTWECPFPSCPVLSCSYSILFGAILESILGKSSLNPDSYSIVVIAAVDPTTKTVAIPFFSLLSAIILAVPSEILTISFSPLVLISIVLSNTI